MGGEAKAWAVMYSEKEKTGNVLCPAKGGSYLGRWSSRVAGFGSRERHHS